MSAEMSRKFQKRGVFLAHPVQHPDSAPLFTPQPDDLAARSAELPLQRLNPLDG